MGLPGVLNHIEGGLCLGIYPISPSGGSAPFPLTGASCRRHPGAGHSVAGVLEAPRLLVRVEAPRGGHARSRAPSRFPEHLMKVCRIYAHSGMGEIPRSGQARQVNRCAVAYPRRLLSKPDPLEDP